MPIVAHKMDERYSYADYSRWPEDERWELLDGIPYDMSPAPGYVHQAVSARITERICQFLADKKGPCRLLYAPLDVLLPDGNESDDDVLTVVQPDIIVVCDQKKLITKGCRGAPDFVVEILSPSTASKDLREKLGLYEKHGVKEYWIVDPEHKLLIVYLPTPDGKYMREAVYASGDKLASKVLSGLTIQCGELFE